MKDIVYIDKNFKSFCIDDLKQKYINYLPTMDLWFISDKNTANILNMIHAGITIPEIKQKFQKDYNIASIDSDIDNIIEQLIENNIISTDDIEVKNNNIKCKSVYIEITDKCNLLCAHCFGAFGGGKNNIIPLKKLNTLIDEMKRMGVETVIISGGEPTLHPDFKEICNKIINNQFKFFISTNGMNISDYILSLLKNDNVFLQISLEGITKTAHEGIRGNNTFDICKENIDKIINSGFASKLVISTTVNSYNKKELSNIIDWCSSNGIKRLAFKKLLLTGRAAENCKELLHGCGYDFFNNHLRKIVEANKNNIDIAGVPTKNSFSIDSLINPDYPCPLGESIRITASGDVYPCQLLLGEKYIIGNIFSESLNNIIEGDKLVNIINLSKERLTNIKECNNCRYIYFCGGGCLAQTEAEYHTINHPYPYCAFRKETLDKLIGEVESE